MKCLIYESTKRMELYLYVREEDGLPAVPEELWSGFGRPRFAMELELTPERRLARADVREVMRSLDERGFYLQMPPPPLGGRTQRL